MFKGKGDMDMGDGGYGLLDTEQKVLVTISKLQVARFYQYVTPG